MSRPLWFNAKRAEELVKLFEQNTNKCRYGPPCCSNPDHYFGELKADSFSFALVNRVLDDRIADFKAEDKAHWQDERKAMHSLNEPARYYRGRFNPISREIYFSNQPTYVNKGLGISAVTFRPIAKVRISSSYWYLYIDIPLQSVFKTVSRNAKRKAVRYGIMTPEVRQRIDDTVNKTVTGYLNQNS
jgi:hypothetical protein